MFPYIFGIVTGEVSVTARHWPWAPIGWVLPIVPNTSIRTSRLQKVVEMLKIAVRGANALQCGSKAPDQRRSDGITPLFAPALLSSNPAKDR